MNMSLKSHLTRCFYGRRALSLVSLLLLLLLIFSPIGSTFGRMPTFTSTSYDIAVRNEAELQKAVYNAQPGVPIIIALNTDIVLKSPFTLNYHKNITLTSTAVSKVVF